jgi:pimeloyl-ACP methyl ester carboxylesterase
MDRVEVRGLQIAYRRAGHGPPLVLVHGAPSDSRVWRRQLDDLADSFMVVAWDAPGCGESEDPPDWFRLPDYADALAGVIARLDLGRPHVLGHSFGGALVLELYRRHPSLPASLILTGAYAGWAGSLSRDEVDRRLRFALDAADRLPGGFDPTSMRGLFSDAMSREAADELAAIMSEARPIATRSMAHALAEADLRDSLSAIDVPTLLLQGEVDERSPLDVADELRRAIPNSRLHVLAGLGHVCYLEDPGRFDAALRDFLESHAGG